MQNITQKEYDRIMRGIAGRVNDIRRDDSLAMVKRQIPIEAMRSFKDDETIEVVFRLQYPVSSIKKLLQFMRK